MPLPRLADPLQIRRARRYLAPPMGAPLIIRLTRLSPTHHRFAFVRPDGSAASRELETRSLLLHDLVHFAVESEAGLQGGFFGRLAHGFDPDGAWETGSEAAAVELVVGPLQGAQKETVDPEAFVARVRQHFQVIGQNAPDWLTPDLIARAQTRLSQLTGQWKATRFDETMELRFPA